MAAGCSSLIRSICGGPIVRDFLNSELLTADGNCSMELHQLRYFCAVAETGSLRRAAQQSHVAQPSLSQQTLKLEHELGARLFDRLGRSVRLTDVGKAFLPRARGVLRELEAARGDVLERKASIGGTISVGVIPTIAPY